MLIVLLLLKNCYYIVENETEKGEEAYKSSENDSIVHSTSVTSENINEIEVNTTESRSTNAESNTDADPDDGMGKVNTEPIYTYYFFSRSLIAFKFCIIPMQFSQLDGKFFMIKGEGEQSQSKKSKNSKCNSIPIIAEYQACKSRISGTKDSTSNFLRYLKVCIHSCFHMNMIY